MDIIDLHNYVRKKEYGFPPLEKHDLLMDYSFKASKWMGHRNWTCYWNFDQSRKTLIKLAGFDDVDFNIAVGDSEDVVMKHLMNNYEKKDKICNPFFRYIGWSFFNTNYTYWTILYAY